MPEYLPLLPRSQIPTTTTDQIATLDLGSGTGSPKRDNVGTESSSSDENRLEDTKAPAGCKAYYKTLQAVKSEGPWQEVDQDDVSRAIESKGSQRADIAVFRIETNEKPFKASSVKSIIVSSKTLKDLLLKVCGKHTDMRISFSQLEITSPFTPIVQYWSDLSSEVKKLKNDFLSDGNHKDTEHLIDLVQYVCNIVKTECDDTIGLLEDLLDRNAITYDMLRFLLPPGILVYARVYGRDMLYKLSRTEYSNDKEESPGYLLHCNYVEHDGRQFGTRDCSLKIPKFEGEMRITKLAAYPLKLFPHRHELEARLIERYSRRKELTDGESYGYKGIDGYCNVVVDSLSFNQYHGPGWVQPLLGSENDSGSPSLDQEHAIYQGYAYHNTSIQPIEHLNEVSYAHQVLTERQKMLCSPFVGGFNLTKRKWELFDMDSLRPLCSSDASLEDIVLPLDYKRVLNGIVKGAYSDLRRFAEGYEGKRNKALVLLSGPPGTGKTMTTEILSKQIKRPLLTKSSFDFVAQDNRSPEGKTITLETFFKLGRRFKAIMVIEDAEGYVNQALKLKPLQLDLMEKMETHQGVVFLHANELMTPSASTSSHIDLVFEYTALGPTARRVVWEACLADHYKIQESERQRAKTGDARHKNDDSSTQANKRHAISEKGVERLGVYELNGHHIRRSVLSADLLAKYGGERLQYRHIDDVMKPTPGQQHHLDTQRRFLTIA